jgi:hypothetical protein
MLKLLAIGLFGLVLILATGTPGRAVKLKIDANPELSEIVIVSNEALPTLDAVIRDFAKSHQFRLSMAVGYPRHDLIAELKRHDLKLMVANPLPDPREVHLFAYLVPDSQIELGEMQALLSELKCQLLPGCM